MSRTCAGATVPTAPGPYRNERADGAALADWITAQPWSDGRLIPYGGSYAGYAAWALAAERPVAVPAVVGMGPSTALRRTKPAGALADRWDRRRTLTLTSVGSAVLVGSIPIAAAADVLTTTHLLVVACLSAGAFVFFDAAAFGALPALVGPDGVARATGSLMTDG